MKGSRRKAHDVLEAMTAVEPSAPVESVRPTARRTAKARTTEASAKTSHAGLKHFGAEESIAFACLLGILAGIAVARQNITFDGAVLVWLIFCLAAGIVIGLTPGFLAENHTKAAVRYRRLAQVSAIPALSLIGSIVVFGIYASTIRRFLNPVPPQALDVTAAMSGAVFVLAPIAILWYSIYLLAIWVSSIVTIGFAATSSKITTSLIAKGYALGTTGASKITRLGRLIAGSAAPSASRGSCFSKLGRYVFFSFSRTSVIRQTRRRGVEAWGQACGERLGFPSPACQTYRSVLSIIVNESTVRSKSCLADSSNRIRAAMIASGSPERATPPKHCLQRNHQSASHQFRTRL